MAPPARRDRAETSAGAKPSTGYSAKADARKAEVK